MSRILRAIAEQPSYLKVPTKDWLWLLALAFLRFVIGTKYGLGVDEAHYALYAVHIDWSYFDHPPLIGWITGLFVSIFGTSEWAVRMPATICGLISSVLVYRLSLKTFNDPKSAKLAMLALNLAFLTTALHLMFLPDTILLVLTLWLLNIIVDLLEKDKLTTWLQLGLCLGLCGLTKYTAAFFIPSLIGIATTERAWKRLLSWKLVLAALIALVLVSPVFYWNYIHKWISFNYQQNHVLGQHAELKNFLNSLLVQFLAYSPFILTVSVLGLWFKQQKLDIHARVGFWLVAPAALFFAYTSFSEFVLPHWTLIVHVIIFTFGLGYAWQNLKLKKWVIGSLVATGLITLILISELIFQFIPYPAFQSPYADVTGWPSLRDELIKIETEHPETAFSIGVSNWVMGSRSHYYLADVSPVFVLDNRYDQFDIWESTQPRTKDFLFVQWKGFDFDKEVLSRCESVTPVKKKIFFMHGKPVNEVQIFWCKNFKFVEVTN